MIKRKNKFMYQRIKQKDLYIKRSLKLIFSTAVFITLASGTISIIGEVKTNRVIASDNLNTNNEINKHISTIVAKPWIFNISKFNDNPFTIETTSIAI